MYDPTKPYKKQIIKLISETWDNPYISIKKSIYPIITKKFNLPEVDHSDGIGTKGIYHWKKRTFKNAVLDALAMNLNDLSMMRAIPYKLQNHIIIPKDDQKAIFEIIKSLSKECKKRKIAITGGETSIHNNIQGMDISVTLSGIIKKEKQNKVKVGDVLLGFKSNGLHSNGFSKAREIFNNRYRKEFTEPTAIYSDLILKLNNEFDIHGLMHITGGSFVKLKDILGNVDLEINNQHKLQPHKIFRVLYNKGISDNEMYKTFNCGIGFIISVCQKDAGKIVKKYSSFCGIIGRAISGRGKIKINSAFSDSIVSY